ncbi:conserved exported hypothetical protein [Tenacibaculum litopenaei]|uniref:tRNA (guanine-N1)-methyltransferase n=1 Tax=Tenacibaculum litopenaei TaxID=396016 RepID=UPI0038957414
MRLLKIIVFFSLSFMAFAPQAMAQNSSGSVREQFEELYKKSGSYQQYKVVKKTAFTQIQKNVLDSIKGLKSTIKNHRTSLDKQQKRIGELEQQINSLNNQLTSSSEKENLIDFLGLELTKSKYKLTVWILIFSLLGLLLYFIYSYKNSNTVTKETKQLYEEIEQEFEQHKRKSLEKEQQLRRKLQDEINKQRGV